MLDFHEPGSITPRRSALMPHESHLPEYPEIGEVRGRTSDSLVLSVDGLCVAIVHRPAMLKAVVDDLSRVMSERHSPSGSLLVGPTERPDLSMAYRKQLANLGISVERSKSEDLVSAARGMLNDFWLRHRVQQKHYHEAQSRG